MAVNITCCLIGRTVTDRFKRWNFKVLEHSLYSTKYKTVWIWPLLDGESIIVWHLLWNLEGGSFTRDFERWMKEGTRNGASFPVGALWGEAGGGVLYWGPWRLCRERHWRQASLSIGALLGNLEGGSYTGDLKKRMESSGNGTFLTVGALWGEPGGRVPLLGTLKDMLSKALEMGVCFHRGPILGNMGGHSFARVFEEVWNFFIRRTFMRN